MRNRKAFTLIELLVVIAIIAILAAILFPVFAQAKLAAKKTVSLSNVKELALAGLMYCSDNEDVFPLTDNNWAETWMMGIQPYVKDYGIYRDPTDDQPINDGTGPKYTYWANGIVAWGKNGFELRGVVNPDYGFTTDMSSSRSATAVTYPADTIFFCMRIYNPWHDQYPDWWISGVWDPWYGVITVQEGIDSCIVLPGQNNCWSKPDPTYPGLIYGPFANLTNFAFTDGHAKTMNAFKTVNMSAPMAGGRVDSGFNYMWDSLRP